MSVSGEEHKWQMLRRSVTGHSKVENVGQNSSAKYPQQVKQFWRASVTDLLFKSFFFSVFVFFFSFFSFFFFPSLSTNDSVSPAVACFLSHSCAIQKDALCVSLWIWLPGPSISFPCLDEELITNGLRTESQASGLKMNVHLILNTTFLIVARKVKKPSSGVPVFIGSGTLVEAANLAADSPTSKMGA